MRIISEIAGVPKGIFDVSVKVYNEFIDELSKNITNFEVFGGNDNFIVKLVYTLKLPLGDFIVGDEKIADIQFKLIVNVISDERVDNLKDSGLEIPGILNFAYAPSLDYNVNTPRFFKVDVDDNIIRFKSDLVIGEYFSFDDILNIYKNEKTKSIISIAHELKHHFDFIKRKKINTTDRSTYEMIQTLRGNDVPDEVNNFLYYMYYMFSIESMVRTTEVYAEMRLKNIDKKSFIDFLLKNETYNQLKFISNYTYDYMITKLKEDVNNLNSFLEDRLEVPNVHELDIDEKIDLILNAMYVSLASGVFEDIENTALRTNISVLFAARFGNLPEMYPEIHNMLASEYKKLFKYKDNPKAYFKYIINDFNKEANKILKKIGKLYSLIGVVHTQ